VPQNLEYPGAGGVGDWDSLYRARGDEVQPHRSVFTGDVFVDVEVQGVGETTVHAVMVLQHPCALRHDGVNLQPRLIVAELREHPIIPPHEWTKHFRKMPLPELIPTDTAGTRNQAAFFSDVYLASPEALAAGTRIACLSQTGVNFLMQRWIHHNSRVVVPTWQYQEVTGAAFEEADLIEEWCDDQIGPEVSIEEATAEAMKWLREDAGSGVMRQAMLDNLQNRSTVRKEMRAKLRSLRS
jgi:hypothetical protein